MTMSKEVSKVFSEHHKVAVTDVAYGRCYSDLCERFYRHCDTCLNVFQVAAASTAVAGSFGKVPAWVSAISGAAIALLGIIAMFWTPAVKAERHKVARDRFIDLHGRAWRLSTPALLRDLASVQKAAPPGPRALEMPAFNRNVRSIGVQPTEKLTPIEWLADAIA